MGEGLKRAFRAARATQRRTRDELLVEMRAALAKCYGALTEEGVTERQRAEAIAKAKRILDTTTVWP